MTEIREEVRTFRVKKLCPSCGEGYLFAYYTRGYSDSFSSKYEHIHKCNTCEKEHTLNKRYPYINYEKITESM